MQNPRRGIIFIVLLALQVGLQPWMSQAFLDSASCKSSVVLLVEFLKFIVCIVMLVLEGEFRAAIRGWTLQGSLLAAGLPSTLYAIQSTCMVGVFLSLDGLVLNVMTQTKVISTAVFVYLLLGRSQTMFQCAALGLCMMSALLASSDSSGISRVNNPVYSKAFAMVLLCIASSLSGLSAALSERSLTRMARNGYIFSAEVAVYTSAAILVGLALNFDGDRDIWLEHGPLYKISWGAIVPCLAQGVGGIFIGQVTKYAGAVYKGFSIIGGIALTSVVRTLASGLPMTTELIIAMPCVCFSIWLHTWSAAPRQKQKDAS